MVYKTDQLNIDKERLNAIVDRLIIAKCPLLPKNAGEDMSNAFMYACEMGVLYVAKKCMESFDQGVSLEQTDRNERTPAFLAVLSRSLKLLGFLRNNGAKTEGIRDKHNMSIESIIKQNNYYGWASKGQGRQKDKVLLLGTGFVGGTTFLAQLKNLDDDGFDESDRDYYTELVRDYAQSCARNLMNSVCTDDSYYQQVRETGDVGQFQDEFKAEIDAYALLVNGKSRWGEFEMTREFASNFQTLWRSEFLKAAQY